MESIILFDGVCNLCNNSVQFIIKRDPQQTFKFASQQSEVGQKLMNKYNIPSNCNSMIYIENNVYYTESDAVLKTCKKLSGGWKLFYGLFIIPRPIRNFFYRIVAKNRYKWFGKQDSCMLPTSDLKKRFL